MIDAVVFDLDGVLIDSEPVWERVRRGLVEEHGGHWAADAQNHLMGMSTAEWADYLTNDLGVALAPSQVAELAIDRMASAYERGLPLLPGAPDVVRNLASRWPLGLASSSPLRLITVVLGVARLADLFRVAVSADEVPRGKPAPDVYLAVARELGTSPESCLAVEDSTNGVRAAIAAGFRCIAVPRPAYPIEPGVASQAALVLGNLGALTPEVVASAGS